jgi:diacylglycerol kinase family enzyme
MKIRLIANRGGGSAGEDAESRLSEAFAGLDVDVDLRLVEPDALERECAEAARAEGVDAVAVAGGDGTVSAAAGALAGTGRPLGLLPFGTLNHFARDAGIPLDLREAAAAIAAGHTRRVDVAEVNGRVFVNNSAVGLYPAMVRAREAQQRRLGRSKRLAMLVASLRILWRFGGRRLTLGIAGREAAIETPLLFVGNNRYETGLLSLGRRETIDGGGLCLYAPLARTRRHFLWLSLRAVFGRPERERDFLTLKGVAEAEIHSRHARLAVSADGEAVQMETPLRYRIRPGALTLIVPLQAPEP